MESAPDKRWKLINKAGGREKGQGCLFDKISADFQERKSV
jgi:hypothetical protein